ncbi:hypothetical protein BV20DRAFT_966095 [Pilatotrama ljubarskyi]|nr:hypothetical protein BV20DRAFT_966095 [Pilatotrama ljubarskyi]
MLPNPRSLQETWLETRSDVRDTPGVAEAPSAKRDGELWFEDGNLVLVAGDVEFKVYRGPLIAHSLVFTDMLSLPQPAGADHSERTERTCPVIPLHDSPDDLRHVLRVFVPGSSLRAGAFEPSYEEVSACIRIGHKYQIDALVQRNLAFLARLYPSDFDSYLAARRLGRPPTFTPAHAIGVVNLARLTAESSLLPAALMECCSLGANIVHGLERPDGTRETLSPEDLGRCFVGRARMAQASARIAHQMFRQSVARGCRHPACCLRVLQRLLNDLGDARIELVSNLDWCASWTEYLDDKDDERELCGKCYKMLEEERPRQLQREVWQVLPTMMGITAPENWGEKRKES